MKKIIFEEKAIDELIPASYNPRLDLQPGDPDYENLKKSIEQFGYVQNIVFNERTGHIVGGHQRVKVLKDLGYEKVTVAIIDVDEDREKALNIGLNKIEGDWNMPKLKDLMMALQDSDLDLDLTGFSEPEMEEILTWEPPTFDDEETEEPEPDHQTLADKFLIPPFSILDSRKGYWMRRKKAWLSLGIKSEVGRGADDDKTQAGLTYSNSAQPIEIYLEKNKYEEEIGRKISWDEYFEKFPEKARQGGTSIFDPVLCEIAYRWFLPSEPSKILDPFSGGSVRGIVASYLGHDYTGIDLRPEQISANILQGQQVLPKDKIQPTWIEGNSLTIPDLVHGQEFDLIFSCPPYYDLEVYSDSEGDLSNKGTYQDFIEDYRDIIQRAVDKLKENRFAVFVVGDVRDKKGIYYNFVADTIQAFIDAGMQYYNEGILITQIGSLAIRINKQFGRFRKLGKTHQNVLVFYKGDTKEIPNEIGEFELNEDELADIILEQEQEN